MTGVSPKHLVLYSDVTALPTVTQALHHPQGVGGPAVRVVMETLQIIGVAALLSRGPAEVCFRHAYSTLTGTTNGMRLLFTNNAGL